MNHAHNRRRSASVPIVERSRAKGGRGAFAHYVALNQTKSGQDMSGVRFDLLKTFARDKRGNIAVIFALASIPLLAAVGCAVDYTMAARIKAKLQSAADAASVGSLAVGSPAYIAAGQMGSTGPVPAGGAG